MKRYRVLQGMFDYRPNIFTFQIQENWTPEVRKMHEEIRAQTRREFILQFGVWEADRKFQDMLDLGAEPFSVIAFHNRCMRQSRDAFVLGAYYPALTGACALGERILNHLTLNLRDFFKESAYYKRVHRKDSFDNWDIPIDALEEWGVLRPEVVTLFRKLRDSRNESLHFSPKIDSNDRSMAIQALKLTTGIIDGQFGASPTLPWVIPSDTGIVFLKKEVEKDPFIRLVYLPNCALVGPKHDLEWRGGRFVPLDENEYDDCDISDEEFIARFKAEQANDGVRPTGGRPVVE